MGEYVKYKDEEMKIGTFYELYYATYQKYTDALKAGTLSASLGDEPGIYALPDSGFKFRFPFPDEDQLPLGDIAKNQYNRGLPVTIDNAVIPYADGDEPFAGTRYQMEITQQKLVHRQSDGKLCLATVWKDPLKNESYRIEDEAYIKSILKQIIKNHVLDEPNPEKKNLYRQVALRILKGYRIEKPSMKVTQKASVCRKVAAAKKPKRTKGKGI